ncbi:class I SAM-dependent methyltransferase [Deinococcus radiomollis]|uniref:class I SAM-dependent methyltransferase n=1 Tax=Deinococcus radiomollis TaxID=468916 RepID=UPI0038919437
MPTRHVSPAQTRYDPQFVRQLFDEMSGSYDVVNTLTSFGFSVRWRNQSVAALCLDPLRPDVRVADLMCGQGESWRALQQRLPPGSVVEAVDFSPAMCGRAAAHAAERAGHTTLSVRVSEQDALNTSFPDASMDAVICAFGLKTLSPADYARFAAEIYRLLRPGGSFSVTEVSVPDRWWLRAPYLWYLRRVIPHLGRLLLGNPENYRMLGVYTHSFGSCAHARPAFEAAGLQVTPHTYFFGCATGLSGTRPA